MTSLRLEDILSTFQTPPLEYRPAPFTILNDEYDEGFGEAQLTSLIESLARAGYGGAYLHPRPGLITEYMSDRWFDLIRHCITECQRCGIVPHLYDENTYPSGFSGGHVAALVPEARSRYVTYVRGTGPQSLPATFLALRTWKDEAPGEPIKTSEISDSTEWVAFTLQDMAAMAWHGETVYPSLLDPRTTEAFIETTYDRYHRELGDLWSAAPSIFTDEPHLPGISHGPWSTGLHLTPYVLGQFRQRLGYELIEHVHSLFFDIGDYHKIRYDFYDLCHRLWLANWALPLERWCREHDIKFTGHYLEHDWPCPYATPGHVHLLAHMDWPGSDMLLGYLLKGHDFFDIQGFEPALPGREAHALYFLRQIHSVANQLGKERVVNECWGAGGSETAPEDWMRIGRWLIIHGVNLLVPHSSWDTIRGGRKADHPPNFAPQSPWFDYLPPLNDELTRLCWATNQGECVNRILILDPLTSAYCVSRKSESFTPAAIRALNDVLFSAEESLPSIRALKFAAEELAQNFCEAFVDFDIGDEYVLEEFGGVSADGLAIGKRTYQWIVLPPLLQNLSSSTAEKLREAVAHGSRLFGVRPGEFFVDGRPSTWLDDMDRDFPDHVTWCDSAESLQERVIAEVPPRLASRAESSRVGIAHMYRTLDHGELIVLVNSSPEKYSASLTLQTARKSLMLLSAKSGVPHVLCAERTANGLDFSLEIEACAAAVLLAIDDPAPDVFETGRQPVSIVPIPEAPELLEAKRLSDNVLVIDVCSVELRGHISPPECVTAANLRYWQGNGMDSNGWNNLIQYRDQILARDRTMLPDSGGSIRYEFFIEDGVDVSGIRLAIECPELWTVLVNEHPVTFRRENAFRDPRINWAPVGDYLRAGGNEVRLVARPFTVRQEIDQIYLLGDFSCDPAETGFRVSPPRPLGLGSWKSQGLPFYDAEVSYRIKLPAGASSLTFPRETWGGALIAAFADGTEIGRIYESPWTLDLAGVKADSIEIRVVGLPKNLFGPWHDANHRWGVANVFMWHGASDPNPRPGSKYDLLDLGLYDSPVAFR
jgi:hypothetical protein